MLHLRLERIKGEIYLVSESSDYFEPLSIILKWKAQGAGFRVPDEQIGKSFPSKQVGVYHVVYVPSGYWGEVELYIEGSAKADVIERRPIEQPKVRANIPTRYYNGCWQKETKREGWVSA